MLTLTHDTSFFRRPSSVTFCALLQAVCGHPFALAVFGSGAFAAGVFGKRVVTGGALSEKHAPNVHICLLGRVIRF